MKSEQASKETMRMPTHQNIGEGSMFGEVIDTGTQAIRRGIGHGTLEETSGSFRETHFGYGASRNIAHRRDGLKWESERGIVLLKPGNSVWREGPLLQKRF